jgi:hypothetical protein
MTQSLGRTYFLRLITNKATFLVTNVETSGLVVGKGGCYVLSALSKNELHHVECSHDIAHWAACVTLRCSTSASSFRDSGTSVGRNHPLVVTAV